jgi:NADPH-dependent 2,4-dienoyl-CoA reductase/sulfur reductase-like enzyme
MSKNLVIIGGGAGGASTAAEAKRNDPSLNVTILQKGKFVSYASCPTPYYIGDLIQVIIKLLPARRNGLTRTALTFNSTPM